MLEPPNIKALKTIDFAFCLSCLCKATSKGCKAFKRAKVLETGKKQILKNNSNIFKDWTISREVNNFRCKLLYEFLTPQRLHANIHKLCICIHTTG